MFDRLTTASLRFAALLAPFSALMVAGCVSRPADDALERWTTPESETADTSVRQDVGPADEESPSAERTVPFLRSVHASYNAAEAWFLGSLRDKGLFRYIYNPKTDEYPDKNNAIRQLMAARLLAELATERADLLPLHRKNLDFYMRYWYRERDGIAYVHYNGKSKLGANAMLLRTLVWSPDFGRYQVQAKKLADGILSLMTERGALRPFLIEPDYEYDKDYLLTFYSGEALVALVEYYSKTGDGRYLADAQRSQDYYIERYVTQMDRHYYPAYVPWHTISLNRLWHIQPKQKYADAIFALNDKLLEIQDRTNRVGRFYNPATPEYGTPHASSDGVFTEGLAYAYEMALLIGDTRRQQAYAEALRSAVGNLISLQYTHDSTANHLRPDRSIGAFRYNVDRSGIRVDSVQHTMDAYRKILQVDAAH